MFNEAVLYHPADLSGWMKKKGGDVMAINPKHMKKRYFVLKGTNLFYFKGEASGGSNTPVGSPLSVVPLEFSLLEVEGQPTETASGKPLFAINLKVSPEFWPRSKHKTYLLGLKSQEAQVLCGSVLTRGCVTRSNLSNLAWPDINALTHRSNSELASIFRWPGHQPCVKRASRGPTSCSPSPKWDCE
mmetsp:Transcript_35029/g.88268  ORF Transcript_35029/g.88268 Transcript_35029/m.88268 type:complete len:187 (-) Transcript_35029:1729-2289(-)